MATEQAYEFYYKMPVNKLVTLKADIQHVRRPGGLPETPSATVAAVRLIVNYVAGSEQ
jgi:carbohydrate-selective porin OprB